MVDLPKIPRRFVTVDDLQNRITPGAAAAPYAQWSRALDQWSEVADREGAIQGEKAGQQAAITTGPDGLPKVQDIPLGGLGSYGHAYQKAALAGYGASLANKITVDAQQLRADAQGDPAAFQKQWKGYGDKLLSTIPQDSAAHPVAQAMIEKAGAGQQADLIADATRTGIVNSKVAIEALIQRRTEEASALARQGGTGTPEFKAAVEELDHLYQQRSANPLFHEPPEKGKLDLDHSIANFQGDALLGQADRMSKAGNLNGIDELADKIEQITNLEPEKRTKYAGALRTFAREQRTEIRKQVSENRQIAAGLIDGLKHRTMDADDIRIGDALDKARALNDQDTVQKLTDARIGNQLLPAITALPPDQQAKAIEALKERGLPGLEGVVPAAPAATGDQPAPGTQGPQAAADRAVPEAPANSRQGEFIRGAKELGISPVDLATIVSYETGGTMNPDQKGPVSRWGRHRGWLQFGEPQAREFGYAPGQSDSQNMDAVVRYLKAHGVKPGMGIMDVYSAVNAGKPGLYDAVDAGSTVRQKVDQMMGAHRKQAWAFLNGKGPPPAADLSGGAGSDPRSQRVVTMLVEGVQREMNQQVERSLPGALDVYKSGHQLDAANLSSMIDMIQVSGNKDAAQKLRDAISDAAVRSEAGSTTRAQLEQALSSIDAASSTSGITPATQRAYSILQDELKTKNDLRERDPIGLLIRDQGPATGRVAPPAPVDWSNSQGTLEGQLRARGITAGLAAEHAELPGASIFRPGEKDGFTQFLGSAPADQVVRTLNAMAQTLPGETLQATMRDLGGNDAARPYVVAASIAAQGDPATAQQIVAGLRVLAANPKVRPEQKDTQPETAKTLPTSLFAPGAVDPAQGKAQPYQDILDAATAIYAAGKGIQGDNTFDSGLWNRSVEQAAGGFVRKSADLDNVVRGPRGIGFSSTKVGNDQKVIAPRPGMTQNEFAGRLAIIRESELRNMDDGQGNPLTRRQFMDLTNLEALGQGRYLVKFGARYIQNRDGSGPYVLDMSR